jgi:hypothetical protein
MGGLEGICLDWHARPMKCKKKHIDAFTHQRCRSMRVNLMLYWGSVIWARDGRQDGTLAPGEYLTAVAN